MRADAAKSLCALGLLDVGYEAFLEIAKLAAVGAKLWAVFAGLLAGTEELEAPWKNRDERSHFGRPVVRTT